MTLAWYSAASADETHCDVEVDLAALGNPGGAEWASVTHERDGVWHWAVYDRWLWDDLTVLASGSSAGPAAAQDAVSRWVVAHSPTIRFDVSHGAKRTEPPLCGCGGRHWSHPDDDTDVEPSDLAVAISRRNDTPPVTE